jgi:hypothetical protein
VGSPPASGATAEAVSSDTMATGPKASAPEVPSSAYTAIGTTEAYSPVTGGIPANAAYAMAWGISMTAVVRPAVTSPRRCWRG